MAADPTDSAASAAAPAVASALERHMRQLIDAMPHLIWMTDGQGACNYLNKRWEEFTGTEAAAHFGDKWAAHLHPDDREHVRATFQDAVRHGVDFQLNCRIRRYDGSYRWFDTRGLPLRDARGHIIGWFGTNTDVHETHEARRALVRNEERLRYVALATHDAVYDWDIPNGVTYRNEFFQSRFAAPAVVRASERWWERHIHPDDRQRVVDSAAEAFNSRADKWNAEYRLQLPDGSYAHVTDRAYLRYDANGKGIRMIGAIADITAYKQAEQSLRDAQARLVSAIEGAHMATWIWDIGAGKLEWDDAAYKLWGLEADPSHEMDFGTSVAMIHPEDRPGIEAAIANFHLTGVDTVVEFRTQHPDGSVRWLQVRGRVERDATGKPMRMAGVYIDVTDRKQAEQTLRDSQDRLLSAMEAGGLATWIWDIKTNEMLWDEAACRLWGQPAGKFVRFELPALRPLIHPADLERLIAFTNEFRRTGIESAVEFRTQRPDGALQWLLSKARVQRDAEGHAIRMAGVYVDITERKRAEEAQLRTQKMEALGTLAGGIAHDFNNLLLAITGNAKLAAEELKVSVSQDHPAQRHLQEINKASARAADLVKRILTFSRQQDAQREAVRVQPLIEEALRLLRTTLPANIEVRTRLTSDVAPVATDAIQIQQVVMNLVTNAVHAIGEKRGSIGIELIDCDIRGGQSEVPDGRYACLSVSDTGSGIEQAIIDRIFDPFFTTKQAGQGTGLGLAVVHGIVKSHGGSIVIDSTVGVGTTFRVYFPVATTTAVATVAESSVPQSAHGERVLYVDDEESLVFLITRVLERLGYRVTGCLDPEQALQEFRDNSKAYDAVVTDLSMRGMNGFELARALRAIRSDVAIIMTSGYVRTEDRDTAKQCGIREVVLKPNTVDELGHALDRALSALRV